MKPLSRALAAIFTAGLGGGAAAGEPVPTLAELVGLLPQAAAVYGAAPIFSYTDLRAMERSGGAPSPESEAAFDASPREQQGLWVDATYRLAGAPQWLSQYFASRGPGPDGMAGTVGFDMFAIDRTLEFGQPPTQVLVLAGDSALADPAQLQAALEPRGFARKDVGAVPVWHRYEDLAIDMRERNMADPFGGQLGRAARIAVFPTMLVGTASWPVLEAVLAAPRAPGRGGDALRTMLRAAVVAVEDFAGADGVLVQAMALPLAATVDMPEMPELIGMADPQAVFDALKAKLAAAPAGPMLPPYPFSVLADLQVGAEQINLIVLPYADAAVAAAAGNVLAARLRDWAVPGREVDGSLLSRVGGTVEATTVAGDSVALAIVAVRCPLPDAASKDAARPGAVVRAWMQAVWRREFAPLALVD